MIESLKKKLETLISFIPTNGYISSPAGNSTVYVSAILPPAFLSELIEQFLCRSAARWLAQLTGGSSDNLILFSTDEFHFNYLTCPALPQAESDYLVTLGPFITHRLSSVELRYITHKLKLGGDAATMIENFMSIAPYFAPEKVSQMAHLLKDCIRSSSPEPDICCENYAVIQKEDCCLEEEKFVDLDFVERNYAAEARIMSAIEHGDVEDLRKTLPSLRGSFNLPQRYPNDPLRELKNLSITINSISLRAAIRGGLSMSLAHNMSHTFAVLIEQQTSAERLRELDARIFLDYAEAVRKYGLNGRSELVARAIRCIRRNLASCLSLSDLARQVSVSPEHLSRQFAREMGITLTSYIHKTKILESCGLLASHKFSISEIALTMGYSSPSHYTKMFERHMGSTPKNWQKQIHAQS